MYEDKLSVLKVNFTDYMRECIKTSAVSGGEELLKMTTLGFAGERGEVLELLKKHAYHGHPLDQDKLAKELGDVMWYLAVFSYEVCKEISEGEPRLDSEFKYRSCETALGVVEATSVWQSATNRVEGIMLGGSCFDDSEASIDDCVSVVMIRTHELLGSVGSPYSVDDILRGNIKKLRSRYPNGFSAERSKNRAEGDT